MIKPKMSTEVTDNNVDLSKVELSISDVIDDNDKRSIISDAIDDDDKFSVSHSDVLDDDVELSIFENRESYGGEFLMTMMSFT